MHALSSRIVLLVSLTHPISAPNVCVRQFFHGKTVIGEGTAVYLVHDHISMISNMLHVSYHVMPTPKVYKHKHGDIYSTRHRPASGFSMLMACFCSASVSGII